MMCKPLQQIRYAAIVALSLSVLTGCADVTVPEWVPQQLNPERSTSVPAGSELPVAGAATAETLDQSSALERSEAAQKSSMATRRLGTTVATLGDATEPGFWLKTPLVKAQSPGVLRSVATGKTAQVTLIPIDGPDTAGSRVSLSAMRLLELPLTDLAELEVSGAG